MHSDAKSLEKRLQPFSVIFSNFLWHLYPVLYPNRQKPRGAAVSNADSRSVSANVDVDGLAKQVTWNRFLHVQQSYILLVAS